MDSFVICLPGSLVTSRDSLIICALLTAAMGENFTNSLFSNFPRTQIPLSCIIEKIILRVSYYNH